MFAGTPQARGFSINPNGTFRFKRDANIDDDNADAGEPNGKRSLVRVCSPFKPIRKVEHPNQNVSVDCAFIDSRGRYVGINVSSAEFLGAELVRKLTEKGFQCYGRGAATDLLAIFNELEPEIPTVRAVARQGVQPSGAIVLDWLVLGEESDLTITDSLKRGFSTRGTHSEWIERVSLPALNSQTIVFAISHALAAILKYAADLPDAVFNLLGPSSKGKTMALYASASTMGTRKEMITTWLASAAGFEALAIARQGWSWIIDEARIGLGDKFEENIIFALLNGRTKSKAPGHGGAGVELCLWALSSNEDREDDPFKGQPRSGADVRLFTIPVGYDLIRGIFEKAKDTIEAKAMADAMLEATKQCHGTAIVEFSVRLLERPDWRAEISARLQKARLSIQDERNLNSVQLRGLDSFLPIAAAGEWATELGITGWQPGDATKAVKTLFDSYLAGPPTDYWAKKRKHDGQQGDVSTSKPSSSRSDDLAAMLAGHAKLSEKLADEAAAETLAFLRSQQAVPLAKLVADGRPPHPGDPHCPVFIHPREEGSLLCVAPERLKLVLSGRDEIAVKRLREQGILVRNGQPTSLRFTLKVDGEPHGFYALPYSAVVGVGDLQP
jgi:hypothetical protein